DFETLFETVSSLRNLRNSKGISPKIPLPLEIRTDRADLYISLEPLVRKLANIGEIRYTAGSLEGVSFLVKSDEFYVNLVGEVDADEEKANLLKELEYAEGFLNSVTKKLSN